jgi:hypothetical protein
VSYQRKAVTPAQVYYQMIIEVESTALDLVIKRLKLDTAIIIVNARRVTNDCIQGIARIFGPYEIVFLGMDFSCLAIPSASLRQQRKATVSEFSRHDKRQIYF